MAQRHEYTFRNAGPLWRVVDWFPYQTSNNAELLLLLTWPVNSLRPRQNGRHFADDIFKRIFFNENFRIPIKISLKFVPKGSNSSIGSDNGLAPARRQAVIWTNDGRFTDAYMGHSASMS